MALPRTWFTKQKSQCHAQDNNAYALKTVFFSLRNKKAKKKRGREEESKEGVDGITEQFHLTHS